MKILLTNDDGYRAKGLKELVSMMKPYGELTVVAPKFHQSGMSMAVGLGYKPIAVKRLGCTDGADWWYVDDAPASCVKFAIDNIFTDSCPDVVISGINHGSNAGTAELYSATIGAAKEAALAGIMSIAVSLNDFSDDADFSTVRNFFPRIFDFLLKYNGKKRGVYYNINVPSINIREVKGIRVCHQGIIHWVREFQDYDWKIFEKKGLKPIDRGIRFFPETEEGEQVYMMVGDAVDDPANTSQADQIKMKEGYISIVAHNIDTSDYEEISRLEECGINNLF